MKGRVSFISGKERCSIKTATLRGNIEPPCMARRSLYVANRALPLLLFTPSIRYGICPLYLLSGMCVRQNNRVVPVIDLPANFPCGSCHNKIMLLRSLVRQYHFLRSEEHTSELQSRGHLVCRLLLEKKNLDENIRNPQPRMSLSYAK